MDLLFGFIPCFLVFFLVMRAILVQGKGDWVLFLRGDPRRPSAACASIPGARAFLAENQPHGQKMQDHRKTIEKMVDRCNF